MPPLVLLPTTSLAFLGSQPCPPQPGTATLTYPFHLRPTRLAPRELCFGPRSQNTNLQMGREARRSCPSPHVREGRGHLSRAIPSLRPRNPLPFDWRGKSCHPLFAEKSASSLRPDRRSPELCAVSRLEKLPQMFPGTDPPPYPLPARAATAQGRAGSLYVLEICGKRSH